MSEKEKLRIRDSGSKPEIFATTMIAGSFDGAALVFQLGRKTMEVEKTNEPPKQGQPPVVVVTGTIILTPQAAMELAKSINNILAASTLVTAQPTGQAKN